MCRRLVPELTLCLYAFNLQTCRHSRKGQPSHTDSIPESRINDSNTVLSDFCSLSHNPAHERGGCLFTYASSKSSNNSCSNQHSPKPDPFITRSWDSIKNAAQKTRQLCRLRRLLLALKEPRCITCLIYFSPFFMQKNKKSAKLIRSTLLCKGIRCKSYLNRICKHCYQPYHSLQ